MKTNWVFDPTPPSGARTGGDVAEHAFTPDIEVFVREVLQNAKDQHVDSNEAVGVVFRLIKLEGTTRMLRLGSEYIFYLTFCLPHLLKTQNHRLHISRAKGVNPSSRPDRSGSRPLASP